MVKKNKEQIRRRMENRLRDNHIMPHITLVDGRELNNHL